MDTGDRQGLRLIVRPMGIWVPSAALKAGESVELTALADSFQGRRKVGGRVTVTAGRLIFIPNRLDRLTGGRSIDVPRKAVTRVWAEPAGTRSVRQRGLGAAFRDQVGIDAPGGPLFLTLIRPERLINALTGD
jgi:hypothetical protein